MNDRILVVGLGNPGQRYSGNRHNFGFMVLDELKSRVGTGSWTEKFQGLYCQGFLEGRQLALLKPTTFMNLSGRSVAAVANFYRITSGDIIVIHDELDFPFGTVRVKEGGGTGGHKGVASIAKELGDQGFIRIRMGIGSPTCGESATDAAGSDYVLSNFTPEESRLLTETVDSGVKAISCVVGKGVAAAMNIFNRRKDEIGAV